jgi:hypothetical protein
MCLVPRTATATSGRAAVYVALRGVRNHHRSAQPSGTTIRSARSTAAQPVELLGIVDRLLRVSRSTTRPSVTLRSEVVNNQIKSRWRHKESLASTHSLALSQWSEVPCWHGGAPRWAGASPLVTPSDDAPPIHLLRAHGISDATRVSHDFNELTVRDIQLRRRIARCHPLLPDGPA